MQIALAIAAACLWVFVLRALDDADLKFWHFIVGAIGLFLLLMFVLGPHISEPLARAVCALAGLVGDATGTFESFFKFGVIYVPTADSSITLQIDMECSGVIETFAFVALLAFYRVYTPYERIGVGAAGAAIILVANAVRIIVICEIVHFFGVGAYGVAHTYIGRLLFYAITVALYFYVFTKPQVKAMKVGEVTYEDHD